jgi:hypothetical protein
MKKKNRGAEKSAPRVIQILYTMVEMGGKSPKRLFHHAGKFFTKAIKPMISNTHIKHAKMMVMIITTSEARNRLWRGFCDVPISPEMTVGAGGGTEAGVV